MDAICQQCAYLIYDEDYEEYICDAQMDEDDYSRLSAVGTGIAHITGMAMNTEW